MKKKLIPILIFAAAVGTTAFLLLFNGPRMATQIHLRAFDAVMPQPPRRSVPFAESGLTSQLVARARSRDTALTAAEHIRRGRVYYGYYCAFCHGDSTAVPGEVGRSYVPIPPDLGSAHVQALSDSALARAMLSGNGHAPVLRRVIQQQYIPSLVAYTRTMRH